MLRFETEPGILNRLYIHNDDGTFVGQIWKPANEFCFIDDGFEHVNRTAAELRQIAAKLDELNGTTGMEG